MKSTTKYIVVSVIVILISFFSCNKSKNSIDQETIITGRTSILVDETLLPIVKDQVAVFENEYNAKITLEPKSEKECVLSLVNKTSGVIVLPRKLDKAEVANLNNKKIKPRSTEFAIDAITLIINKNSNDTLIDMNTIVAFLKGKKNGIKGLVFDNPNSSTVNYIKKLSGLDELPQEGVFSFKTNNEVIKYVSENEGMIGVVGINWLSQPKPNMQQYVDNVNIMSVKNQKGKYVYPSQESIGTREYPLARVLYIINCQGYEGLGMGFASFIAGERGQRIVLKSGLAPIREPGRNITIRNQIELKK